MTKLYIIIFLCCAAVVSHGQSQITGRIVDEKGEPIIGANVFISDSYDGTSTDVDGNFSFTTSEEGDKVIKATFIGYTAYESAISLPYEKVVLDIVLRESINRMDAVVISAGSFTAGEESNREVLKPLDIVTTAGATADIAGVLNTLPGTQTVGETGRLFVRGGEGYETKTFIDGIEVLSDYGPSAPNTPGRSRFSPFMFSGTSFSTGGYSAEYGQALSSALVLKTKDVPEATRTDIGLMSVGADISHTRKLKNGAVAGKVQYTDLTPYFAVVKQGVDWEKSPQILEGNVMFRKELNEKHEVKLYSNFSWSDFLLFQPQIIDPDVKDKIDLSNNFQYINSSLNSIINDKWSVKSGVSFTNVIEESKVNEISSQEQEQGLHFKSVLANDLSEKFSFIIGAEHFIRNYTYKTEVSSANPLEFKQGLTALFAEADIYTSNKFVTRIGVRGEYNGLQNRFYAVPRFSVAYKTGEKSQVSIAYGQFNQTGQNDLIRINNDLRDEEAAHYIINYQREVEGSTFRIEGYHKNYSNLIKFNPDMRYNPAGYSNEGSGYARGIDMFWRDNKSFEGLDYWISYSYLDTERDYLDFPVQSRPSFASEHNFSAVAKYFIGSLKTQVGATYSFTSGRPYHNPNLEGFNTEMTKAYHDLSMNFSYLMRSNIIIHGSVTNVLGLENIFTYESSIQPTENGEYVLRPVKQTAPRFIFLGIFITLSKNKAINQLPNL